MQCVSLTNSKCPSRLALLLSAALAIYFFLSPPPASHPLPLALALNPPPPPLRSPTPQFVKITTDNISNMLNQVMMFLKFYLNLSRLQLIIFLIYLVTIFLLLPLQLKTNNIRVYKNLKSSSTTVLILNPLSVELLIDPFRNRYKEDMAQ